jgi:hypothetical protein
VKIIPPQNLLMRTLRKINIYENKNGNESDPNKTFVWIKKMRNKIKRLRIIFDKKGFKPENDQLE